MNYLSEKTKESYEVLKTLLEAKINHILKQLSTHGILKTKVLNCCSKVNKKRV